MFIILAKIRHDTINFQSICEQQIIRIFSLNKFCKFRKTAYFWSKYYTERRFLDGLAWAGMKNVKAECEEADIVWHGNDACANGEALNEVTKDYSRALHFS